MSAEAAPNIVLLGVIVNGYDEREYQGNRYYSMTVIDSEGMRISLDLDAPANGSALPRGEVVDVYARATFEPAVQQKDGRAFATNRVNLRRLALVKTLPAGAGSEAARATAKAS